MSAHVVWVLVLYMSFGHQGGPTVIDNIASQAECERVRALLTKNTRTVDNSTLCVEVKKATTRGEK